MLQGDIDILLTLRGKSLEAGSSLGAEYVKALKHVILIMDARPDSPEGKERELLLGLLKKYEQKHVILPELDLMPS